MLKVIPQNKDQDMKEEQETAEESVVTVTEPPTPGPAPVIPKEEPAEDKDLATKGKLLLNFRKLIILSVTGCIIISL